MLRLGVICVLTAMFLAACSERDWSKDTLANTYDLSRYGDVQTEIDQDLREHIESVVASTVGSAADTEVCPQLSYRANLEDTERLLVRCNSSIYLVFEDGHPVEMRTSTDGF